LRAAKRWGRMDKRIHLELRGRAISEVKHLEINGCQTGGEFEGLTNDFVNLETLDLANSNLTNLKGFPKLKNLKKLDLSGNRLARGLEPLKECTNLTHILLNGNNIKRLEELECLKSLQKLKHLEIALSSTLGLDLLIYRAKVFSMLPNLQYLDQVDIDGNEEDEDEDELVHNGHNGIEDSDGDDELEDEEGVEDEEESEVEDTPGLDSLYNNSSILQDEGEDYEDEDASEDDDDLDDSEEEEVVQSTTGKRSPTEGGKGKGKGKKRKLEDEDDPEDV